MKRDILLLMLCLCILGGVKWLESVQSVSAIAVSGNKTDCTLVLDAGHGGEDGGASTAAGDKESDINLSIVLKTQALMTFLGTEPRLTRNMDRSLHSAGAKTIHEKKVSDLKNRVIMIENIPDAVLISVHQNHFTDPKYGGAQIFFSTGDVNRQWGEYAQGTFQQILDPNNSRKAKRIPDGIYLFEHISCPAILVECGFLSNSEEAALLLTNTYQKKVAMALAGAYFFKASMSP